MFAGTRDAASARVRVGVRELPAPDDAASGSVDYVVRPEKLRFVAAGEAVLSGTIAGPRRSSAITGCSRSHTDVGPVQLTMPNTGLPQADEGDEVGLAWSPEHARVLPRGDGVAAVSASARAAPYWLASPATLVILALVVLPLLLTLSLSLLHLRSGTAASRTR